MYVERPANASPTMANVLSSADMSVDACLLMLAGGVAGGDVGEKRRLLHRVGSSARAHDDEKAKARIELYVKRGAHPGTQRTSHTGLSIRGALGMRSEM